MKTFLTFLSFILCSLALNAQDKELIKRIHNVLEGCSYYEVTEEMFQAISEDERFKNNPEIRPISEIRFLIFVECPEDRENFYHDFESRSDLDQFKIMVRSKNQREQFSFFRKKNGDLKEYLLLHDKGLTYMVTSLNISTINELQGYIQMAGAFGGGH